MAVFSWESTRMIDSLDSDQRSFIRSLFNKYQIYVITETGYRRSDQQERVKGLVNKTMGLSMTQYKSSSQFHNVVEMSMNDDFRKLSAFKLSKKQGVVQPKGLAVMNFDDKKHRVKFGMNGQQSQITRREKKSIKVDVRHARNKLLSGGEEVKMDQMERMMMMMEAMQEQMNKQAMIIESLSTKEISGTNTQMDGQSAIEFRKATREMARDLGKLTEMTVKGQDITQVAWNDLPTWFQGMYRKGLYNTAIGIAKIPLKSAKAIVNEFYVKPMVMVADFWKGKIQFVLGHVHWFFLIGGVAYVYTNSDYDTVNDFYKAYGGDVVDTFVVNPAWMVMEKVQEWYPNFFDVLEGIVKMMYKKFIPFLLDLVKKIPNFLFSWFILAIKTAFKETMAETLPSWLQ